MKPKRMYRQGDVLIEQIDKIPGGLKRAKCSDGLIILARGEATGHHHSIFDRATAFFEGALGPGLDAPERFLRVGPQGAAVEHQEHDTINLPPGNYRVRRQRECTPEAIRNVAD